MVSKTLPERTNNLHEFCGLWPELGVKQTAELCQDEDPLIIFRKRLRHLESFEGKICHLERIGARRITVVALDTYLQDNFHLQSISTLLGLSYWQHVLSRVTLDILKQNFCTISSSFPEFAQSPSPSNNQNAAAVTACSALLQIIFYISSWLAVPVGCKLILRSLLACTVHPGSPGY